LHTGQTIYVTQLHGPHLHLLCLCGGTTRIDHELVSLVDRLRQDYAFEADLQHLTLLGCAPPAGQGAWTGSFSNKVIL
jgi:hypothetical protein